MKKALTDVAASTERLAAANDELAAAADALRRAEARLPVNEMFVAVAADPPSFPYVLTACQADLVARPLAPP